MSARVEFICKDEEKHKSDVACLAFIDGHLYSGGQDGTVKIWDIDLKLKRSINVFGADKYVYALCVDVMGRLYVAGSDGVLKCLPSPLSSDNSKEIYSSQEWPIQTLYCHGESVWAGDGLGVLMLFQHNERVHHYKMIEEIKSLAVEGDLVYTIRESDLVVSEIVQSDRNLYKVKQVIPGKSPMKLFGPWINAKRSLVVTATRDGKGLNVLNNCPHREFVKVWHKDNAHDLIINAMSGNEKTLFTAGYDGIVKMWTDIMDTGKLSGELNIGSCVNSLCHGPNDHTVFVGTSDGKVRKALFA